MAHHDESFIDKLKGALGMGSHDDHEHPEERSNQPVRAGDDMADDHDDSDLGVDGATQAAGSSAGMSGGLGASGAMGGSGAVSSAEATPDPSEESGAARGEEQPDER